MRRLLALLALIWLLCGQALAAQELVDTGAVAGALSAEARQMLEGRTPEAPGDIDQGLRRVVAEGLKRSGGAVKSGAALCGKLLAVVILSSVLRGYGGGLSRRAMALAGAMAISAVCLGPISGFFTLAAETVDAMAAFGGFLFPALATATAATGALGTSSALYGVTVLVCGVLVRAVERLILPGISCYMALMIADSALGGGLKVPADALRQGLVNLLKLSVLAFTTYLSVTGVIRGSADSAAVKAAKLTISSAVPVVGGMIADASETLLVSASLLRSGLGAFGLLGVAAVSVTPFLRTGIHYLLLKLTAGAAGLLGEKELSGLIGAMAGAMGLAAGVTGACALILMIGCVCFMKASV